MKIEMIFLRSKVARRIFILFTLCALLPIAILAILSFSGVTKELHNQSRERLHQLSKSMGMSILERLALLETEMKMVTSSLAASSVLLMPSPKFSADLEQAFIGLVLVTDRDETLPIFGRIQDLPELTPDQKQHVSTGETLILTKYHSDRSSSIFIGLALDLEHPERGLCLAKIEPSYLWFMGYEEALPAETELCILDASSNILYSTLANQASFSEQVLLKMRQTSSGQFEWISGREEYLANYWSVALGGPYLAPGWTVVLSEPKSHVLAPIALFKKVFPLVILGSLWVVLLLSVSQIRKSLIPLEKLKEGTRRIARRDFETKVKVKSRDEFEELAASFNTMASQLGRQFKTLTTMSEIDRAILSALETGKIVDTVLSRMRELFPCHSVSVTILDSDGTDKARIYIADANSDKKRVETIQLRSKEIEELYNNPESLLMEAGKSPPSYLVSLAQLGLKGFLVLPIFLKKKLSAVITLGYLDRPRLDREDLEQARQLADQVGVALSNARLIKELDELNWGTLRALARAIDAKSPWTAGHSERSTKLALQIGKALGLASQELEILHRGGLLHDIGKLGIPPSILDNPGRLKAEEKQVMDNHVRLGARILEPIAAYAEVIPIVLQHHESFDGTGYPDGLKGETISLNARIFSAADRFEALTSDRPYRKALQRKQAIELIKKGKGRDFDPEVVEAFLKIMAEEEKKKEKKRGGDR